MSRVFCKNVDAMDDEQIPQKPLPTELLDAARTMANLDSELFIFGGFPQNGIQKALAEARRKWILACKFDRALSLWHPNSLFSAHRANKSIPPREIARAYGLSEQEAEEAENTWLESVWIWPDATSQENAANMIWALDENGVMIEGVLRARIKIRNIRGAYHHDHHRRRSSKSELRDIHNRLNNPALVRRARLNLPRLHPEQWIRYVALAHREKHERTFVKRWREKTRNELGRLIPNSAGKKSDYDAVRINAIAEICNGWARRSKKNGKDAREITKTASVWESVPVLTHRVLEELKYGPLPSVTQIRRIIRMSFPARRSTANL